MPTTRDKCAARQPKRVAKPPTFHTQRAPLKPERTTPRDAQMQRTRNAPATAPAQQSAAHNARTDSRAFASASLRGNRDLVGKDQGELALSKGRERIDSWRQRQRARAAAQRTSSAPLQATALPCASTARPRPRQATSPRAALAHAPAPSTPINTMPNRRAPKLTEAIDMSLEELTATAWGQEANAEITNSKALARKQRKKPKPPALGSWAKAKRNSLALQRKRNHVEVITPPRKERPHLVASPPAAKRARGADSIFRLERDPAHTAAPLTILQRREVAHNHDQYLQAVMQSSPATGTETTAAAVSASVATAAGCTPACSGTFVLPIPAHLTVPQARAMWFVGTNLRRMSIAPDEDATQAFVMTPLDAVNHMKLIAQAMARPDWIPLISTLAAGLLPRQPCEVDMDTIAQSVIAQEARSAAVAGRRAAAERAQRRYIKADQAQRTTQAKVLAAEHEVPPPPPPVRPAQCTDTTAPKQETASPAHSDHAQDTSTDQRDRPPPVADATGQVAPAM